MDRRAFLRALAASPFLAKVEAPFRWDFKLSSRPFVTPKAFHWTVRYYTGSISDQGISLIEEWARRRDLET